MATIAALRGIESTTRSERPLTDDEIFAVAPSIYSTVPHENLSENYAYIPTIDVLKTLRTNGFDVYMAGQNRVRSEEKMDVTRHVMRLRHASQQDGGGFANEILLLNSHDGTGSFRMIQGAFRFICMNGLVMGDFMSDVRIQHKGDVIGRVLESAHTAVEQFRMVNDRAEAMRGRTLSEVERHELAEAMLAFKFGDEHKPITSTQALVPRRLEDYGHDLWSTFNVLQENLIKGGINGYAVSGRNTRTRAVKGITADVNLNRGIWNLADAYIA